MSESPQAYRLPTHVVPTHYDLTVQTDLENSTFAGVVHTKLTVREDTSEIVLNTLGLELGEISIRGDGLKGNLHASKRQFEPDTQRGIFTFPESLAAGTSARLTISFTGELTGGLSGYYRSVAGQHDLFIYSLTQFQPTAARKAFPCWDEPALKAAFAITLISQVGSGVVLSNMPAESTQSFQRGDLSEDLSWLAQAKSGPSSDDSRWELTRFKTTPPISTYLVAYANGPFAYLEASYTSPISGISRPLRIYATEDLIDQGHFALDIMRTVMPLYEEIFDLEYPLPKLDILVSSDFDLGGMENWGLIAGRAQCFLVDPNSTDLRHKQYVASMVSHEVAHMWFGDITTMEWWDNLYLNEGFATLVGEKIVLDRLFPEWQRDARFVVSDLFAAFALDGKLSSHPIEVECPDANKIIQIFDNLSYSKAASVLRMLASYVGEGNFLKGVSVYLKKHMYKNTVTKDLWEGIQTVTDRDIPKMMDNWVKEMGYPVLTVSEKEGGIQVRQNRFLETGPATPEHNKTIWTIPLNLLTGATDGSDVHIDSNILLTERESFFAVDTSQVFKLNANTTGFFVVQYTADRLRKLGQQAASPNSPFSTQDKIGIVRDAFALARAGYAPVAGALGLVDAVRVLDDWTIWDAIATSLSSIAWAWWENPTVVELLDAFRRSLFVPIIERMGIEHSPFDSPEEQQLRTKAIEQAAEAGDPWVICTLKARFDHFFQTGDHSRIASDQTAITYRIGVQEGGKAEWQFVKSLTSAGSTPAQALSAMNALGGTRDPALAAATLAYALAVARDQDVLYYVRGLQRNVAARRFLAEQVLERFDELEERYAGTFTFNRWLDAAFGGLSSEEDYERISAFFKVRVLGRLDCLCLFTDAPLQDKNTAKYELPLRQTLDNIYSKAQWIKRSTEELTHWLENREA